VPIQYCVNCGVKLLQESKLNNKIIIKIVRVEESLGACSIKPLNLSIILIK
jgi:hypothetical protein